jgi:hypothetical protein
MQKPLLFLLFLAAVAGICSAATINSAATITLSDTWDGFDYENSVSVAFNGTPAGSVITETEVTASIVTTNEGVYYPDYYAMHLTIGGTTYNNIFPQTNASYSDLNGQAVNGQTIILYSEDIDYVPDYVTLSLSVTITYNQPLGPPAVPFNPVPASGTQYADLSGNLTWDFGADTETYDLWFGPLGSMVKVVNQADADDSGTYPYSGLVFGVQYTWQVIARNTATNTAGPVWYLGYLFNPIDSYPYYEGFDGPAIPIAWSQHYESGSEDWTINNGGEWGYPTAPHTGPGNAFLFFEDEQNPKITKLVSPMLNLAGENAVLKFWHAQISWFPDQDELKVFYKTSEAGAWNELAYYNEEVGDWTERTIDLPDETGTYFIAFEGLATWGYGVCVDDIQIILPNSSTAGAYTYTGSVTVIPDPIINPLTSASIPASVAISGLPTGFTVALGLEWAPPEVNLPNAGLTLTLSGADFSGTQIGISHNLGFIPQQLSYRIWTRSWVIINNPGSWTDMGASLTLPSGAEGEIQIVFPQSGDQTLPVVLSAFTALQNVQGNVSLTWVTESETQIQGFNILRSGTYETMNAMQINSSLITASNTSQQSTYSIVDSDALQPGNTYYYWLENVELNGTTHFFGPVSVTISPESDPNEPPVIPIVTALGNAYPNPFKLETTIPYSLKEAGNIRIEIYNLKGQLIWKTTDYRAKAGRYETAWNGKDLNGKQVSTGIYLYRMIAGKYSASRKIQVIK